MRGLLSRRRVRGVQAGRAVSARREEDDAAVDQEMGNGPPAREVVPFPGEHAKGADSTSLSDREFVEQLELALREHQAELRGVEEDLTTLRSKLDEIDVRVAAATMYADRMPKPAARPGEGVFVVTGTRDVALVS